MAKKHEVFTTRISARALDEIPLSVVRLSTDRRLMYVNKSAIEAGGPQLKVGASLSDLALDASSKRRLNKELDARFKRHRGSSYPLVLARKDIGTKVTLEVSAVPDYDAAGKLLGSIGFITDKSIDKTTEAMHRAIENADGWKTLLRDIARELHDVIEFDTFAVIMVSRKGNHLRSFFEDPEDDKVSPIRWWPMPAFVKTMMRQLKASPVDVEAMFSKPTMRKLEATDPETRYWRSKGYKHLLRLPIYRERRQVAVAMLERKTDRRFSQVDMQRLLHLPISEAVNMALTLDRQGEMQFALDLIQQLGNAADSVEEVAQQIVTQLRGNYSWEHVSMFRVDQERKKVRLLRQSHNDGCGLSKDHEQDFHEGLLGAVARTRKPVNEDDVSRRKDYLVGMKDTRSEMCLPIPGTTLRWILNVESKKQNAFADEEQKSVERLLQLSGLILDRAAMIGLKDAILTSIADAVIQTDADGRIEDLNPAAERTLGWKKSEHRGRNLGHFIRPATEGDDRKEFVNGVMKAKTVPSQEAKLKSAEGEEVPVLISGAALPHDFGGKVFVASDLRNQKRAAEYEKLKQIFRQVADETRLPLALASKFLGEVPGRPEEALQLADKALAQVRKADLPLERLIRLASASKDAKLPTVVVDVAEVVGRIVEQLPQSEARHVRLSVDEGRVFARAARQELSFCLQSLLAFLLKYKAQDDDVAIRIGEMRSEVFVSIGLTGAAAGDRPSTIYPDDSVLREFALAEPTIKTLMQQMSGDFRPSAKRTASYRLIVQPGSVQ